MAFVKKLCNISRFEIKHPKYEIKQDQIDRKINEIRKENAIIGDKDGPICNEDIVYVSFTGTTTDGEKFRGSDADNVAGIIGEGDFMEEFEQQILGHYKGDNFDITVIPKDDHFIQEVVGQKLLFNVTINRITYRELPELNNYFVKQLGIQNVNTVDDFIAFTIETINTEKLTDIENVSRNMIINQIIENSEIEVTQDEIDNETENIVRMFEQKLFYEGLILKEYLKAEKLTKKDLEKKYRNEALRNIKIRTLITHLVDELKIEVSDEELIREAEELELKYNYSISELIEMGVGKKEAFRKSLKHKKVMEVLLDRGEFNFV